MKKKTIITVCAALILAMLSGCAPSAQGSGLADKLGEMSNRTSADEQTDETAPSNNKKKKVVKKKDKKKNEEEVTVASRDYPELYRRRRLQYDYDDEQKRPVFTSDYQLFLLSEESCEKYPKLDERIRALNDVIATEAANEFTARGREIAALPADEQNRRYDDGRLPFTENEYLYVRRADDEIFSFIRCFETPRNPEFLVRHYTGYTIDVNTGDELTLEDIISDEDEMCRLLAPKIIKAVNKQQTYDSVFDESEEDIISDLRDYLSLYSATYVLDPQGITFFFNSETFVSDDTTVSLLFSEDKDGKVFRDRFRNNAPDEWAMEIPLYRHTAVDLQDDGVEDELVVYDLYDYEDECEEGLIVSINDRTEEFDFEDMVYDQNLTLIHRNNRTNILNTFSSYDYGYVETLSIEDDTAKERSLYCGVLTMYPDWDELENHDSICPTRIVTDPARTSLTVDTDMLSSIMATAECEMTKDGELVPILPVFIVDGDEARIITLKDELPNVPVIDDETYEPTGEEITLRAGCELLLCDTDTKSFVDCRPDNGELVRIEVCNLGSL